MRETKPAKHFVCLAYIFMHIFLIHYLTELPDEILRSINFCDF